MLTIEQKKEIEQIINTSLDIAEKHWINGGHELVVANESYMDSLTEITRAEVQPSKIPKHSKVYGDKTEVDEFIALVMDMRDSSKHLMENISFKTSKVTELERVFYETSALLPAVEQVIKYEDGSVTEYLGDGVLALFNLSTKDKKEIIYDSYNASTNILGDMRDILNEIFKKRYALPSIDLGIGLASSKAIVSLIGLENEKFPKAFGKCIFRATKLSDGRNEIYIDSVLHEMWPTSEGGGLKFKKIQRSDFSGYSIEFKN